MIYIVIYRDGRRYIETDKEKVGADVGADVRRGGRQIEKVGDR
jgi:hypothetical protein